jgi:hypothetical protein
MKELYELKDKLCDELRIMEKKTSQQAPSAQSKI